MGFELFQKLFKSIIIYSRIFNPNLLFCNYQLLFHRVFISNCYVKKIKLFFRTENAIKY